MLNKASLYWLIVALVLLLSLTLSIGGKEAVEIEALNLTNHIKVEPKFLYREKDAYSALVVGELQLDFDTEKLTQDLRQYNLFSIEGFSYKADTRATLSWQTNTQSHEVPLQLNNNSHTVINFKASEGQTIKNLRVNIIQDQTFGTAHSFQDEIKFKRMLLDHHSNFTVFGLNFNNWLAFNPLSFSAINGYTSIDNQIYESLIKRISMWLLASLLIFFLLRPAKKHLLYSLMLAWLIPAVFHLNNRANQQQQIQDLFPSNSAFLNKTDQTTFELAQQLKSALASINVFPEIEQKIIIVGSNNFTNQRLVAHLNEFNTSIRNQFNDLPDQLKQKNLTLVFLNKSRAICEQADTIQSKGLNTVYIDPSFCVMRPL
ncbi:hypothetical protein OS175_08690 [Marinicella sp. S1101]|uniref:hypothetical protein n=1 Tax=Marinicella marina TaxID=2996016 RepID=UPI002260DA1B|nr:hypothetical protein [Marinicella marina]MCX7553954.1 hypothetical protein [Marinicella marina]